MSNNIMNNTKPLKRLTQDEEATMIESEDARERQELRDSCPYAGQRAELWLCGWDIIDEEIRTNVYKYKWEESH